MSEVDELLVKLVGDAGQFEGMIKNAIKQANIAEKELTRVEKAADKIVKSTKVGSASTKTSLETLRNSLDKTSPGYDKAAKSVDKYIRNTEAAIKANVRSSESYATLGTKLITTGKRLALAGSILLASSTAIGIGALRSAGEFEQTTVAFETMLGSATKAKSLLEDLTTFAALTPFEMPELQQTARGLIQFGESQEEVLDTLKILGDAASATSSSLGMIGLIYNQIRGVGKLLTQDFRQLSTRGVLSLQDIAKHFGIATSQAQEFISSGKVGFKDVRAILKNMTSDGGKFANMMEKQAKTYQGMWSTFTDTVGLTARAIGEKLLPTAKVFLGIAIETAEWIRSSPAWVKNLAAGMIFLGIASGTVLTVLGTLVIVAGTLTSSYAALIVSHGGLVLGIKTMTVTLWSNVAAWTAVNAAMSMNIAAPILAAIALYQLHWKKVNRELQETKIRLDAVSDRRTKVANKFLTEVTGARGQGTKETNQNNNDRISSKMDEYKKQFRSASLQVSALNKEINSIEGKNTGFNNFLSDSKAGLLNFLGFTENALGTGGALAKSNQKLEAAIKERDRLFEQYKSLSSLLDEKGSPIAKQEDTEEAEASLKVLRDQLTLLDKQVNLKMTNNDLTIEALENKFVSDAIIEETKATLESIDALEAKSVAMAKAANEEKKLASTIKETNIDLDKQIKLYQDSIDNKESIASQTEGEKLLSGLNDQGLKKDSTEFKDLTKKVGLLETLKKENSLLERGKSITEQYISDKEKLLRVEKELTTLLNKGYINQTTFNDAMKDAKGNIQAVTKATRELKDVLSGEAYDSTQFNLAEDIARMQNEIGTVPIDLSQEGSVTIGGNIAPPKQNKEILNKGVEELSDSMTTLSGFIETWLSGNMQPTIVLETNEVTGA